MTDVVDTCIKSLKDAIGNDNVLCEKDLREYYSQDVFATGKILAAVVQPKSIIDLVSAIKAINDSGLAMYVRGGGYSYTDAYIPLDDNGISIDLKYLNRIIEVNTEDMFVTVESGCTWEELDSVLEKHAVRAEFWGPLSGYKATIGGGVSQGAASLGSAKHGMSAESVLGMDIITSAGELFSTGSSSQESKSPFFRNYGPDITGLFCGDSGLLGIKATVTLRLQKRAKFVQGLSYGFDSFSSAQAALKAIAHSNVATECFGFSARAMETAMASQGFWNDLKIMFAVGASGRGLWGGIILFLKMVFAGRRFAKKAKFFAHCAVEGANKLELKGHLQHIHAVVDKHGYTLPNTMPTVMRAQPFAPYPVVGQNGTRMLPMHAILPFSQVKSFHFALENLYDEYKNEMSEVGMTMPAMYATLSTNGFLYEPVLYWPDTPDIFHEKNSPENLLKPMRSMKPNESGRKLARKLFVLIVALMNKHGGIHMQIGKAYPYLYNRSNTTVNLIKLIKQKTNPKSLINPGALGL